MALRKIYQKWVGPWVVVLLLAQPSLAATPADNWSSDDAAHLLRRAGFGGTPAQINSLHAMGKSAAVEYLLTGKLPADVAAPFPAVELDPFKLEPIDANADRKAIQKGERQQLEQLRGWWVDRMVRTDRPLEEKMTLFWHGLFTSGMREVKSGRLMAEQNDLFRRSALGNYQKLTHDILHDGAMLRYLDAAQNVKGKPNENLARELMELFTMGEGNGYTERDIAEAARALTGMGIAGRDGQVMFRRRQHDDQVKTILGRRGNFGPDDVAEIIFSRPEPAKYLARRLWENFAYANPAEADLAPVIRALHDSKYEIKPALRVILMSDAFYSDKARFALIKSPVELVVGTARILEQAPPARGMVVSIDRMGQQLLQPPNVRGWPGGEHWITTATLYTRYNVASTMAAGGSMGVAARNPKKGPDGGADAVPDPTMRESGSTNAAQLADAPTSKPASAAKNPRAQRLAARRQEASRVDAAPIASLFPALPKSVAPVEMVEAAAKRLLQRPLLPEKRAVFLTALGEAPISLGERKSDERVRAMITLMMSTPDYQLE